MQSAAVHQIDSTGIPQHHRERELAESYAYHLVVEMVTHSTSHQIKILLEERRTQNLKRSSAFKVCTFSGPLELEHNPQGSIFLTDTAYALELAGLPFIEGDYERPEAYASEAKILQAHSLVDEINQRLRAL